MADASSRTHRLANASSRTRRLANGLLVGGYALAVGAGLKFVPMWRNGDLRRFLAFEVGTVLVTAGLVLRRRPVEAALNGLTAVGLGVLWAGRELLRPLP